MYKLDTQDKYQAYKDAVKIIEATFSAGENRSPYDVPDVLQETYDKLKQLLADANEED